MTETDAIEAESVATGRRFPIDGWEIVATVLLSLATLASAFSGYQASRWGAEQSDANRSAAAARTESTRDSNVANRHLIVDVTAFGAWADAVATGDERLKDFYRERFRPELAVAVDAWIATVPAGEIPSGTPFEMEAYHLAANDEADRQLEIAEAQVIRADTASQRVDRFVFTAVMYASVLFFAGIASKMRGLIASRIAIALAAVMLVIATTVLLRTPWNI